MAAVSDLDILDRIRAIMQAYSGYSIANDLSEGGAQTALPSFIVNPLDTAWEPNGQRYFVTQNFEMIGIVSLMTGITKLDNRLAAYRAAMPVMRPWVAWLHAHPRLRAPDGSDSGLGGVTGLGTITAGGYGPWTYDSKDYSAFRIQLPVITSDN